jgi:DnaJ homolog subfamily C member 17
MAGPTDTDAAIDYYALLGVSPVASESEIRRAYRKTSIKYHPDKVEPTPANLDKFHQLQLALNVLTDADEKAKYDQTRESKLRRQAEHDALEARRRKLKEDLEARESQAANGAGVVNGAAGVKRAFSDRELKINRIREENRKRMREAGALKAAAREQQQQEAKKEKDDTEGPTDAMQRSVKIRWIKAGDGLDVDQQSIEDEFASGEVENVVIMKDKKRRVEGKKEKVVMGTAAIVFSSLRAAKAAVQKGPWDGIESVAWAADKDPEPS